MEKVELVRELEWKGAVISCLMFGDHQLFTLCEKWRDNKASVSCIPDGEYLCEIVRSPKFGEVYEIKGVPNRSHILMHTGNTVADTEGCELYGRAVICDQKEARTHESLLAKGDFMAYMKGQPFKLVVSSNYYRGH